MRNLLTSAFAFALLAAIGNAVFVFAQRKSLPSESPFLFIIFSLSVCVITLAIVSVFLPKADLMKSFSENARWILICGFGLAITYIGFYYLYSHFGATFYILYAILSFLTTSVIVGIFLLKENFNMYYFLSILCAIATLYLFYLGKQHS